MTFLWPNMLFLLLLAPVLTAFYVALIRHKHKAMARYANLTAFRQALGGGSRFKRHIPPALVLIGAIVLVFSMARPMAVVTLPSERGTVILTMDVSGSMRATDIDPTRITAAQRAAKAFVAAQPETTRVGIVAFAATAFLVLSPTLDREEAARSIDNFETQFGTAVGSGIQVALHTLFPDVQVDDAGFDGAFYPRPNAKKPNPDAVLGGGSGDTKKDELTFQPVAPGSNKSAVIVLLSDGRTMNGPDPIDSARMAAERGVRVFTVGFGTANGVIPGFGGRSIYMQLDEPTLKQIAAMTGGTYFHATSDTDLTKVFQGITTQLVMEREKTEITAFFAAAAAAVMVLSALLSMLWYNRIA